MELSKFLGWILILIGLLIIFWTIVFTYNIFIGQVSLPQFFSSSKIDNQKTGFGFDIQSQINRMIGEQLRELIPPDTIIKLLNLIAWSVLASLFIFAGAQISSLGIKLIKI